MNQHILHRHYPIEGLNFRDFWDICSHYQRVHPKYRRILYSVDGYGFEITKDEGDVSKVLQAINSAESDVSRYIGRYYISDVSEPGDYGNAKMIYLPKAYDLLDAGLHFFTDTDNKLLLYQFENFIYNSYSMEEIESSEIEYGLPCEVLAAVIDMRGFSTFCEQPNIESPYTCGLMSAFYGMVRNSFKRYPPDMVKFLGDGVLATWQTTSKDRNLAIEICVDGLRQMPNSWHQIINGPEFTHGAPEGIGSGMSFGLASKITIDHDYIGRPINVASRLCAICPPNTTYISTDVPESASLPVKPHSVRIKSYGETKIWMMVNK